MVIYDSTKPLLIRVPTIISRSKDIQLFDQDNLYPQRCEEAVKRSYTLKSVLDSVADFLAGDGFEDPTIGKLIVNDSGLEGETLNKILRKVCKVYSRWETIALHIGYDMNYRMSSITQIPFENVRFPIGDESGRFDYYWYSTNWEAAPNKERKNKPEILAYHAFNPDPLVVEEQINEAEGIENYRGQILFLTPDDFQYPTATFDPVIDHAQVQNELGMFKLGYTQNGMMATLAVLYRGEFESEEERREFKALVKRKTGAKNANTNIGIQDKTGQLKISDMFQQLQPANLDKLFELTESSAVKAILENEGWPKILVGVQAEGTLFNQESMVDAYTYANAKTRNRRANISETFSTLLKYWTKPIISDAKIKEKVYGSVTSASPVATTIDPKTGTQSAITDPNNPSSLKDDSPDSPRINQTLTNLTGRQSQSLDRIFKKYQKGAYSSTVARIMLKLSVGLTDEEIDEIFEDFEASKEL